MEDISMFPSGDKAEENPTPADWLDSSHILKLLTSDNEVIYHGNIEQSESSDESLYDEGKPKKKIQNWIPEEWICNYESTDMNFKTDSEESSNNSFVELSDNSPRSELDMATLIKWTIKKRDETIKQGTFHIFHNIDLKKEEPMVNFSPNSYLLVRKSISHQNSETNSSNGIVYKFKENPNSLTSKLSEESFFFDEIKIRKKNTFNKNVFGISLFPRFRSNKRYSSVTRLNPGSHLFALQPVAGLGFLDVIQYPSISGLLFPPAHT